MRRRTWNSWTVFDSADGSANTPNEELNSRQVSYARSRAVAGPTGLGPCVHCTMSGALERAIVLSEVRLERVARIREALTAGRYCISAAYVAQKLIDAMRCDVH